MVRKSLCVCRPTVHALSTAKKMANGKLTKKSKAVKNCLFMDYVTIDNSETVTISSNEPARQLVMQNFKFWKHISILSTILGLYSMWYCLHTSLPKILLNRLYHLLLDSHNWKPTDKVLSPRNNSVILDFSNFFRKKKLKNKTMKDSTMEICCERNA